MGTPQTIINNTPQAQIRAYIYTVKAAVGRENFIFLENSSYQENNTLLVLAVRSIRSAISVRKEQ